MDVLKDLQSVYQMLEDAESRYVYINRLNYLITGDYMYIDDIVKNYLPHLPVLKKVEDLLMLMSPNQEIILYGAGKVARDILPFVKNDKRFIGFCSGTKSKQEKGYLGYPVICPEELLKNKDKSVIVCTTVYEEEILDILQKAQYPEHLIFRLNGYHGYLDQADEEEYFEQDFFQYGDDEILIDAGCFDLQTSLQFTQFCKSVKSIYAFEPDPNNFEKCIETKTKMHLSQAKIFPIGTWSEKDTLLFDASGDVAAHINQNLVDGSVVPVEAVDKIVDPNDRVTFIKMDVEGAELESLKGAKNTIRKYKPKLAICIYHKPEDMVKIPLYIKSLVPEYHLYIRHHSNGWCATILYAVI